MNTKDLVSIKVNEKTGVVHILASKRRNQPVPNKKLLADECEQRLIRMYIFSNLDYKIMFNSFKISTNSIHDHYIQTFECCY